MSPAADSTYEDVSASSRSSSMTVPDFTLRDQADTPVTLSDYFDAGTLLLFLRGDW